ncbi:bifunctional helix-turn-helix transcriptional regulator/GNAT family N-acetyltransferase [Pseudonocardia endophytica]|uniref:MarR family transcriptional regulator with acetyltransferase activity n=1 Tax=Pseudonocardia endophytica TaxID=401976 RepID=A0A4R1IAT5_PSEEN|nr:bifunctional helix-turn-helix transcriptional regulator/GNAT family N-acetyltransferase [Pseudonocardia endophytica]TCK27482.1 MarR family transcriptional regulator with acetyltransferase activity [Pseudonocardia endophytica]
MSTGTAAVQHVRAFNRFYTRVIGVLDAGLAGSSYTLTEARVLFELADRGGVETGDLRRDLGLDAGYLSRILGRFDERGLVERERASGDGRKQVVRLTDAGRATFRDLDEKQTDAVRDLLAPLGSGSQDRLVAAMRDVRRELDEHPAPPAVVLRGLEPGDLGWVVSRHGSLYASEYGWDGTFETLVAGVAARYAEAADPRSAGWIAEVDGERAGSVFCVPGADEDTAVLRLLLVEPGFRGLRIGSRLVDECLRFARRAGFRRITLWTVDLLDSARHIYERAGFHLDDENTVHRFGAELNSQNWSRAL